MIIETITTFLISQVQHIGQFGYVLAFVLAFSETIIGFGMIVPGSSILIFLGGYAALTGNLDFFDLVFFAAVGAILGDNVNYYLGKKFGKKWQKEGFWIIKPSHFEMGHVFFQKHGGKSVLLGRFVPMIKEVAPLIAGSMKMNNWSFFIFNLLGGIGWAFEFLGLGFIFAGSIVIAKIWLGRISFLIISLLLLLFFFSLAQLVVARHGKQFFKYISRFLHSLKNIFLQKALVKKWIYNHPKTIGFLQRRISRTSFTGLPFTLLSVVFLYFLFGYLGIIENFVTGESMVQIDERLANMLYFFRDTTLSTIFLWITALGIPEVVISFTVITSLIFWVLQKRRYIPHLWVSIIGASGISYLSKLFFGRPRPELSLYLEHTPSFPSSHAAIALALYGFLAWIFIRNVQEWKTKVQIFFISALIVVLIGFSRLYLGVHYLSDVIGGYFVGGIGLIFALTLLEYSESKYKTKGIPISTTKKVGVAFLLFFVFSSYLFFSNQFQKNLSFTPPPKEEHGLPIQNIPIAFTNPRLKFTETITGRKTEPLNFIFITKKREDIKNIFVKAGWSKSDKLGIRSSGKIIGSLFGSLQYETAPITPLFWNSEVQDMSFQKLPERGSIKTRHHIRVWETSFVIRGKKVFAGNAVFDEKIKWGITHKISADIDNEREFVFNNLNNTGQIVSSKKIQFTNPVSGKNFSGDYFITDGKTYVLEF